MANKNLCGVKIEYTKDKEFHDGMFHCYSATSVDGKSDPNDTTNNFVTIESDDGKCIKLIAMCPEFEDAKAVVCAMGIAKNLVDGKTGIKDVLNAAKSSMDERLSKAGYDTRAMEAKMDELMKSGKSADEILKYMKEHREDFLAKKSDDSKGRW